jgi:hypothetical protein
MFQASDITTGLKAHDLGWDVLLMLPRMFYFKVDLTVHQPDLFQSLCKIFGYQPGLMFTDQKNQN